MRGSVAPGCLWSFQPLKNNATKLMHAAPFCLMQLPPGAAPFLLSSCCTAAKSHRIAHALHYTGALPRALPPHRALAGGCHGAGRASPVRRPAAAAGSSQRAPPLQRESLGLCAAHPHQIAVLHDEEDGAAEQAGQAGQRAGV
eukprot:scaffold91943_cov15-Tisochrysis_lutea.AAC.1